MLTLPVKLNRAQTRILKANDLVCVGLGAGEAPSREFLFRGKKIACHVIDLKCAKPYFTVEGVTGSSKSMLYFLPKDEAAWWMLSEKNDLFIPHVPAPRKAKSPAKPDPLFGIVKSTLEISHFHKANHYVPEYVISSLAKKYGVSEADLRKICGFVQEKN